MRAARAAEARGGRRGDAVGRRGGDAPAPRSSGEAHSLESWVHSLALAFCGTATPVAYPVHVRAASTMASALTDKLSRLVKEMRGQARITEANVQDMLREVRMALLEADVALPVVRDFIARVKDKALGPGGAGLAVAGPGAGRHRQPRARRDHGRGRRRHQPAGAAAGGDPDGRPAGRGQDHHHRQAGQAPDREAQEEGADGLGRRLPARPPSSSSRR